MRHRDYLVSLRLRNQIACLSDRSTYGPIGGHIEAIVEQGIDAAYAIDYILVSEKLSEIFLYCESLLTSSVLAQTA